ncbi:MAG: hypothetical protein WCL39_06780 [Armatimonadota bacterium]
MSLLTSQKLRDYHKRQLTWSAYLMLALVFLVFSSFLFANDDTNSACFLAGLVFILGFAVVRNRKLVKRSQERKSLVGLVLQVFVILVLTYDNVNRNWSVFLHWRNYLPHSVDSLVIWTCLLILALCLDRVTYYGYLHAVELDALKHES